MGEADMSTTAFLPLFFSDPEAKVIVAQAEVYKRVDFWASFQPRQMWFLDGPTHRTTAERVNKPKEPVSQNSTTTLNEASQPRHQFQGHVRERRRHRTLVCSVVMVTDESIALYLRIVILLVIPLFTECTCNLITSFFSVTLPEVFPFFFFFFFFPVSWWHNAVTINPVTPQAEKTQSWN